MSDTPIIPSAAPVADASSDQSTPISTQESTPIPEPKRYKLKVDGQEAEYLEDEVVRFAQLGKAKEKRFDESVQRMRDAEGRFASMKDKWHEHLQEQGVDPYDAATRFLAEKIRRDMMSPQERESAELRAKVEQFESEKTQREQSESEQRLEADKGREMDRLNAELPGALAKANLPKTPGAIRRVASEMMKAYNAGYDISMDEAAQIVRDEYMTDIRDLVGLADDPHSFLPPAVAEKLMAAHLSKVKSAPAFSRPSDAAPAPKPAGAERLSPEEFRKLFR